MVVILVETVVTARGDLREISGGAHPQTTFLKKNPTCFRAPLACFMSQSYAV